VTTTESDPTDVMCTFCVKSSAAVETMVAGPGVYICNECVALCVELIETKPTHAPALASWQERASDEDLLATLPKVAMASAQIDKQLTIAVRTARARGITWTRIGSALGMTRQSAWERFSGEE
jgi:ATP-dependent protease Clp ATPase subunit